MDVAFVVAAELSLRLSPILEQKLQAVIEYFEGERLASEVLCIV